MKACIKECDSTTLCRSIDFDTLDNGTNDCFFNKISYADGKAKKLVRHSDKTCVLYDKIM